MSLFLAFSLASQAVGMTGCYMLFKRKESPRAGLFVGFMFGVIGPDRRKADPERRSRSAPEIVSPDSLTV
jgi:hypothetical protein